MSRIHPEPPLTGYIKGTIFFLGLLFTAFMYMFIIALTTMPLLLLEFVTPKSFYKQHTRPIYHKINTVCFANWSVCVGRLLVWVYGMKFYATSIINNNNGSTTSAQMLFSEQQELIARAFTAPPAGKVNVIVMNHRTVLDWLFFWGALANCEGGNAYRSLKIVPKAALSKAPIFGWAMQGFRFLFLSRKSTESDLATLGAAAESYCQEPSSDSFGPTILIFAEGTDLSQVHIEKSQEFCKKNNLPLWNKVLAPRALGLGHFLRSIGKDRLHQVLDLTIAYEDYILKERPGERSLIRGRAPQAMHVAIRRFAPTTTSAQFLKSDPTVFPLPDFVFEPGPNLITANQKLDQFVRGIFALKEEVLTNFYRKREDERNFMACLESPVDKKEENSVKYQDAMKEVFNGNTSNKETDEIWIPTCELHLRSFRGFIDRIFIPWFLAIAAFLLNYYQFGFLGFLGVTFVLFGFVRFVVLRKPIHVYLFEEYYNSNKDCLDSNNKRSKNVKNN